MEVTFNSTAAGDGIVFASSASWNTAHDALSGTAQSGLATDSPFTEQAGGNYFIGRMFLPFDTSSLPEDAIVESATLRVYVVSVFDGDNDGDDWINIIQTSQASTSSLVDGDFDQAGAVNNPTEGATRIDLGSFSTSAYNTFTLNAEGLSWIDVAGVTKLGLREGHDAIDSPIASSANNRLNISTADSASNKPELVITYRIPVNDVNGFFLA